MAPTYGMAFQPWGQMKAALYERWERKLEAERAIFLPGGGSLRVRSAENPDALRGVGLDFVVIDEAAFVAEAAWTAALRPALSDRKGRALIISTPCGRNWFWHAYQLGRDPLARDWKSWQAPTSTNRLIGDGEIAAARALLPASVFSQEYEAEFLADGGEVFRGIREAIGAALPSEPIPGHRAVMGVDFGRHQDFTALAVIDADLSALVALDRFTEVGWKVQRDRIAALARRWSARDILAEANAIGEVNIEALVRDEGLPLRGFTTTARSKPPLIEALVKAIEDRELRLIEDEVLIGELEAYTFTTSRYGNISYSAPPGGHDDTVMALALAWRAARERAGLTVGMMEW